jgi:tRNA(His) 5'-end guanylyltransferase
MQFKNLKEKCEYYKSLADYRLLPNSYVIAMLDGRAFSKLIKNRYEKPFDDKFIDMINQTAAYLCHEVQGAKFAYAQSDEISIVLTDFDTPDTNSFFEYRLKKLCSTMASLATAKFNNLAVQYDLERGKINSLDEQKLVGFDCSVWNVPSENDVFAWFLYRQNDCIRNSKSQAAQTYLSHKTLNKKSADEMIELLKNEKGIDWNAYSDGKKFGRYITKHEVLHKDKERGVEYTRSEWFAEDGYELSNKGNREKFISMIGKAKIELIRENG